MRYTTLMRYSTTMRYAVFSDAGLILGGFRVDFGCTIDALGIRLFNTMPNIRPYIAISNTL
jgi:hypothetical protein